MKVFCHQLWSQDAHAHAVRKELPANIQALCDDVVFVRYSWYLANAIEPQVPGWLAAQIYVDSLKVCSLHSMQSAWSK